MRGSYPAHRCFTPVVYVGQMKAIDAAGALALFEQVLTR